MNSPVKCICKWSPKPMSNVSSQKCHYFITLSLCATNKVNITQTVVFINTTKSLRDYILLYFFCFNFVMVSPLELQFPWWCVLMFDLGCVLALFFDTVLALAFCSLVFTCSSFNYDYNANLLCQCIFAKSYLANSYFKHKPCLTCSVFHCTPGFVLCLFWHKLSLLDFAWLWFEPC